MARTPHQSSEITPRPGASIAVFRAGAVLLVERAKPPFDGLWSLPGGSIQLGESAETAAQRELLEETGVRADLIGLVDVAEVFLRQQGTLTAHHVIAAYAATWRAGQARAASDAADVRWAEPREWSGIALTEGTLEIIEKAATLITKTG